MEVVIEVVDKSESTFYKVIKDEIIFGRDETCDIILEESGASKKHFLLEYRQNKWWIVDLDSKNGTFINNSPVKRAQLYLDDVIQVGEAYIRFAASKMPIATNQKLRRPGKKHSFNKSITLIPEKKIRKEHLVGDKTHHGLKELTGIYNDTPPARGDKVISRKIKKTKKKKVKKKA